MIFKRGGSHGVGVDTGAAPDITYDGKWSGWHIETYGGLPYWEAVFFTSGVLTVTGEYNSEWWGIGGGGCSTRTNPDAGRGSTSIVRMLITGALSVSIGAGSRSNNVAGGNTTVGETTVGGGGVTGAPGAGFPYRFGDLDKAGEAGDSGHGIVDDYWGYCKGEGGWLHWREGNYTGEGVGNTSGAGYGAGGGNTYDTVNGGHVGAAVCRIPA